MGDKWLDGPEGRSTAQLLQLADEYRIDSLVLAFEQAIQAKAEKGPITREERYILAVEGLEREVNNGGYDQFFGNSSREFMDVIVEALVAIGCPTTAEITREAIDILKLGPTPTNAELDELLSTDDDDRTEALGRCDQSYQDSGEPIADRLFAWIGQHRDAVRVGEPA